MTKICYLSTKRFDETDIGHLSNCFYASVVQPDYDNWTKIGASDMLCELNMKLGAYLAL